MREGLEQIQQQALKQTLSAQQIQYVKLLSMNTVELNSYLSQLHTENPVVDLVEPTAYLPAQCTQNPLDVAHWINARSVRIAKNDPNADSDSFESTAQEEFEDERYNLQSFLKNQFDLSLSDLDLTLMERLIYSLDASGYLKVTAEQLALQGFDLELAQEAIGYLKTLEPAGIGASGLKECLLIQLERKGLLNPCFALLIENHLEDMALGHFSKIAKTVGCDAAQVKASYKIIKTLNPRPAAGFGTDAATYIVPDVTVLNDAGTLRVKYNKQYSASLCVNSSYLNLANTGEDAKQYINKKLSQAMWVIKAVESRQSTIARIVEIIIEHQRPFFIEENGAMAPLRLKDVAQRISVHESTVSRAISEKYLECKQGVFPLKFFFSSAPVGENDSDAAASSHQVKQKIKALVSSEDAKTPLSDSRIVALLSAEGIVVARRTVSKYREELGILSSNARRQ